MKPFYVIYKSLFILLWAVPAHAGANGELQMQGRPFVPSSIQWQAGSNGTVKEISIYRVVPKTFPEATISNALVTCGLTDQDKIKVLEKNKGTIAFRSHDQKRRLRYVPDTGWIWYQDQQAVATSPSTASGVMNEAEATKSALVLGQQLGISRSQLQIDLETGGLRTRRTQQVGGRYNKANHTVTTNIMSQGVAFFRQEDGIPFFGPVLGGAVYFKFGNNGQIADIEVVWRQLERSGTCLIPTPDAIIRTIKQGRAVIRSESDDISGPVVIHKCHPYYFEQPGDQKQEFVNPYMLLEGEMMVSGTNVPVEITCPVR